MVLGAVAAAITLIITGIDDLQNGETLRIFFRIGLLTTFIGWTAASGRPGGVLSLASMGIGYAFGRLLQYSGAWRAGDTYAVMVALAGTIPLHPVAFASVLVTIPAAIEWTRSAIGTDEHGNIQARLIAAFAAAPITALLLYFYTL